MGESDDASFKGMSDTEPIVWGSGMIYDYCTEQQLQNIIA